LSDVKGTTAASAQRQVWEFQIHISKNKSVRLSAAGDASRHNESSISSVANAVRLDNDHIKAMTDEGELPVLGMHPRFGGLLSDEGDFSPVPVYTANVHFASQTCYVNSKDRKRLRST
jgi:hypothetical protein